MKIIIKDINESIKNGKLLNNLLTYFTKKTTHIHIYSDDGIFEIKNNNLYKFIITEPIASKIWNNHILDYTKQILSNKVTYQLPFNHLVIKLERYFYKINKYSSLQLIVEKEHNIIKDIYFITDLSIEDQSTLCDLDTFLSIIN